MAIPPYLPEPLPGPAGARVPMVPVPGAAEWEYRRVMRNLRTEEPPSEAELDALGRDGWELAGLFSDSPFLYLYFKRPR